MIFDQSYPLTLWIGFTFLLMFIYPLNLISLILFLFGIFAALKNINIGSGDFLYLWLLWHLSLNLQQNCLDYSDCQFIRNSLQPAFSKAQRTFCFCSFLIRGSPHYHFLSLDLRIVRTQL